MAGPTTNPPGAPSGGPPKAPPGAAHAHEELRLGGRGPHKNHSAAHVEEGEGNWLVSYADMMTLLVGFFLILQSFSKVDSAAFEKIKQETTKVFGGEYTLPFEEFTKKLQEEVLKAKVEEMVLVKPDAAGVELSFRGQLFFESGAAELKDEAKQVLGQIIPVIAENAKGFDIVVEGHTDNVPLKSQKFPSNWELSSTRAATVLRMFEDRHFRRDKLKAVGYADTRPVMPNVGADGTSIPANQAANRRVVIKVIRDGAGS